MRRAPTYLLFVCVSALTIFGTVMLYSTSAATHGEKLLKLQFFWIFMGSTLAVVLYRLDYRRFGQYSLYLLLAVAVPLAYLAVVHVLWKVGVLSDGLLSKLPFVGGGATKGTFRWLHIGNRTVQPSEFAKVAIILYLAHYFGNNPRYVQSFKRGVFKPLLIVAPVVVAVFLGGSLSVTAITGSVVMGMFFVAGIRMRYFLVFFLGGALLAGTALKLSPGRCDRLTTYRQPEKYSGRLHNGDPKEGATYQLWLSLLALGSGGTHGVGLNQSRMKQHYLPESTTDFIMSIVGEELGYFAVLGVILAYLLLIGTAFLISAQALDREGMLLAFGVGLSLGLHAFVNIGVVSGFIPTTGITAPLISYGGSNMMASWLCIGLLASVSRRAKSQPLDAQVDMYGDGKSLAETGLFTPARIDA